MDEQLPAFFKRHGQCLQHSPERVVHTFQVAELLAVPRVSKEMQKVIPVVNERLLSHDPVMVHQRISFFCKEFNGGQHAAKVALKHHVSSVSEGTMRANAAELKALLGLTANELNKCLNAFPLILGSKPATVASNMRKLQAHNFTPAQALKIFASRPALAGFDWSSPSNVEKLMYLMRFLQLTSAEIASRPTLPTASLERYIGPRIKFTYRSRDITADMPLALLGPSSWIEKSSDAEFAARFNRLAASPPLLYDESFKQHWCQRWKFLTREMGCLLLTCLLAELCCTLLCPTLWPLAGAS